MNMRWLVPALGLILILVPLPFVFLSLLVPCLLIYRARGAPPAIPSVIDPAFQPVLPRSPPF
ncbi:MAG: hypothetical protein SCM96_03030 [Acidobacteriota bacterium]|nr:hypothetical protein [Acidobacteriota bacterium]